MENKTRQPEELKVGRVLARIRKRLSREREKWRGVIRRLPSASGVLHIRYHYDDDSDDYTIHIDDRLEFDPPENAILFFNRGDWYVIISAYTLSYDGEEEYVEEVVASGTYETIKRKLIEDAMRFWRDYSNSIGYWRKSYGHIVRSALVVIAALDELHNVLHRKDDGENNEFPALEQL